MVTAEVIKNEGNSSIIWKIHFPSVCKINIRLFNSTRIRIEIQIFLKIKLKMIKVMVKVDMIF